MVINNAFDLGEMVYLAHDPDQYMYMIIEIGLQLGGGLMYKLQCGEDISSHYEKELCREKTIL